MKKIEITLEDALHSKLEETSRKTCKAIDQLIQDLLIQSLQQLEYTDTFSVDLLAEGYQTMSKENAQIVEDSLIAQMMALENQNERNYDPDS